MLPTTLAAFRVTLARLVAGRTVKATFVFEPPYDAVIETEVDVATTAVAIVNVALVAPALTSTLAGTVANPGLLLLSATVAPSGGAAPLRVTVPVLLAPPTIEAGLAVRLDGMGGFTVRSVALLLP